MWSVAVFAFDGPDPDIDQRDPRPVVPRQVVGRHLRQFRGRVQRLMGFGDDIVARPDQRAVYPLCGSARASRAKATNSSM
jgi:hypothetical protein